MHGSECLTLVNFEKISTDNELSAILHKKATCCHCGIVNMPLVNISATCSFVLMYLILTPGSSLSASNNQSKSILWVRGTFRSLLVHPFIIILITASLSSKHINLALPWRRGRVGDT